MSLSLEADAFLSSLTQFVWTSDAAGKYRYVNSSFIEYTGLAETALLNRGWQQAIHPLDRERAVGHWKSFLAGRPDFEIQYRISRHDGCYRWFTSSAKRLPTETPSGEVFIGASIDIDDFHRRAEFLNFTADIGISLSTTLNLEQALSRVSRLAVPNVADWSVVFRHDADGTLRFIATEHENAEHAELAVRLFSRAELNKESLLGQIARVGEPVCLTDVSLETFADEIGAERNSAELQSLQPRSMLCIPLTSKGQVTAILLLVNAHSGRRFIPSDLHFAKIIAKRATKMLENADRFEHDQRVALRLQQAFLPVVLPSTGGFVFDTMYVAAHDDAAIGGDWYDAFFLPDGRLVVTIGDVSGKGLEAAVVMSSARQVLRGGAHLSPDPVTMLDAADRALRAERPESYVTAFVAIFDKVAATVTYASAGHPWPMLQKGDGSVRELKAVGLPLGLRTRGAETSTVEPLEAGSTFVFFTDGLIESTRDILFDTERLINFLRSESQYNGARLAQRIHRHVIGKNSSVDDIAILTVSIDRNMDIGRASWSFLASDAQKATAARKAFSKELAQAGVRPVECLHAELVFSELTANVVKHAPGETDITLTLDGELPVLHVCDQGPGFQFAPKLPDDLLAESGRGLFLVTSLTEDFTITPRSGGGSHARAILQANRPSHRRRLHPANP